MAIERRAVIRAAVLSTGALMVLAIVGASCATDASHADLWQISETRLVWPLPPEKPRIEYVGTINAVDVGGRGAGGRVSRFLFGKREGVMVKPTAVAKNDAGLVVISDPSVPTLYFVDVAEEKAWTLKQKLADVLESPIGVAIDAAGKVYVCDSVLGKVFVHEVGTKRMDEFIASGLERPTGIALSPEQDRLHVVDTLACQIVTYNLSGERLSSFGERGTQPGQFNYPTYIATTLDGNLCVSDSLNFRVQVFRPDGTLVSTFGSVGDGAGNFARPKGVGVDTLGRIYVADAAFDNIQVFDPDGTLLLAFGHEGDRAGELSLPGGLFIDSTNTIWVADSFNQRLQVFRLLEDTAL